MKRLGSTLLVLATVTFAMLPAYILNTRPNAPNMHSILLSLLYLFMVFNVSLGAYVLTDLLVKAAERRTRPGESSD